MDETPPPWIVFPTLAPADFPPRQGAEEAWTDQAWRPFWLSLLPEERDAYLVRHAASPAWQEALRAIEPDSDFSAEEDARESERYLAEHAPAPRPSFLKRWTKS